MITKSSYTKKLSDKNRSEATRILSTHHYFVMQPVEASGVPVLKRLMALLLSKIGLSDFKEVGV